MKPPKHLTLTVFHEFKASHSLIGFETKHFHRWKIAAEFSANLPLEGDRLIDLVELQKKFEEICAPLCGTHLNDTVEFSPTSELLAEWVWREVNQKIPAGNLTAITVTLCDLEGRASGAARIT